MIIALAKPPTYPKGDLRRVFTVLAAIEELGTTATSLRIAERCGIDDHSVTRMIAKAQSQAGVTIRKNGAVYQIVDWGPVISASGAALSLKGLLGKPI